MHTRRSLLMATALAGLLVSGKTSASEPQAPVPSQASPDLDRIIEQRMEEAGLVGLGAAIIIDRKPVWSRGYGFADKQRALRFTPDTVMNIGSMPRCSTTFGNTRRRWSSRRNRTRRMASKATWRPTPFDCIRPLEKQGGPWPTIDCIASERGAVG